MIPARGREGRGPKYMSDGKVEMRPQTSPFMVKIDLKKSSGAGHTKKDPFCSA